MTLVVFLLFGLLVGVLARWSVANSQTGGWVMSMLLGVGGAMVGGFLGRLVGLYRDAQPAGYVMSVVGAVALVSVHHWVSSGRRLTRSA